MRGAAETAGRQGVAALSTRKAIKYGGAEIDHGTEDQEREKTIVHGVDYCDSYCCRFYGRSRSGAERRNLSHA
jgi:hypothetical protein